MGSRLVCNEQAAAPELLEAARRMGLELIPVKQGYAKCSLCIVSENAVITADEGLAYTLCRAGLDVLKIIPGCIRLPGYGYGFIGGCGGAGGGGPTGTDRLRQAGCCHNGIRGRSLDTPGWQKDPLLYGAPWRKTSQFAGPGGKAD